MAYDVPAQASIGRSLGMSPNAITSAASTPSPAQTRASVDALVTPGALISSRRVVDDQVTVSRLADRASAASQNSSRVELLVPGQQLERRAGRGAPRPAPAGRRAGPGAARWNAGSRSMPVERLDGEGRAGTAARSSLATRRSAGVGLDRPLELAARPAATSQTRAPLETIAEAVLARRARRPPRSSAAAGRSRRRPARRASSTAASTSRVRSETLPSERTRVPSRSVATSLRPGHGAERPGHHQLAVLVAPAQLGEAALGEHPDAGRRWWARRWPGPGRRPRPSRRPARCSASVAKPQPRASSTRP